MYFVGFMVSLDDWITIQQYECLDLIWVILGLLQQVLVVNFYLVLDLNSQEVYLLKIGI